MKGRLPQRALGILALVFLLAVFVWQFRPWEPHAGLRPLSYWVDRALPRELRVSSMWLDPPRACPIEVAAAVRAIGPRAVPVLLHRVSQPPLYQRVYSSLPIEVECLLPRPDLGFLLPNRTVLALSALGEGGVPQLVEALEDSNPIVRQVALRSLALMGTSADRAAPDLARLLKDREERIRMLALVALEKLGPNKRAALPALVDALQDPNNNAEILGKAASVLGAIGPDAKVAAVELHDLMADPEADERARERAAVALFRISRDPKAMAFLQERLEDCRAFWLRPRIQRIWGMVHVPQPNEPLRVAPSPEPFAERTPPVVKWMRTNDSFGMALLILGDLRELGPIAKAAVPTVENLLRETGLPGLDAEQINRVRQAASDALQAIDRDRAGHEFR